MLKVIFTWIHPHPNRAIAQNLPQGYLRIFYQSKVHNTNMGILTSLQFEFSKFEICINVWALFSSADWTRSRLPGGGSRKP